MARRVSMRSLLPLALLLWVAALLAGCGGGGSGPGLNVSPPSGPTPCPAGYSGIAPNCSAAMPNSISGKVIDLDTGMPLAGAAVSVGPAFTAGALSGATGKTTTASDGSYIIPYAGLAPPFIEISANGYVTLHKLLTLTPVVAPSPVPPLPPGAATLPTYHLTRPTANELAALAQLNADRAKFGTGNGAAPLSFDEDIVEVARWRANDMATKGYFSHTEPGTNLGSSDIKYCGLVGTLGVGGFCGEAHFSTSENIAVCSCGNLLTAEAAYVAEGPVGGHFQAIMDSTNSWIGFGESYGGRNYDPTSVYPVSNYFVEDFVTHT